ncbi:MAG: TonB-dependent receptor [Lewinellaceae bacterium]|nr:TonB-dependent receptor [Saprospiraceae bacterium]MCB9332321.1 TonB-dependent receptor [Lewinellaceae bacterium]
MKKFLLGLALLCVSASFVLGQRAVSGTVSSSDGEALIGATVAVLGTTTGTRTDIEGKFRIEIPDGATAIRFSYTGFQAQELPITSDVYNVVLEPSSAYLDEVVVVGYGTQLKRDVTGSISQVKGESLANLATPSFDQQLAGRAAGVQVTPPSGLLGAPPQIRIRGVNSISSGTAPLVVVDGVPIYDGNQGGFTPKNALGDLNPSDIESYEILKDGAATAIYGSRAANGVLLITTKRGKKGKPKFNYDMYVGMARATNLFDLLDAEQFVMINNEKSLNTGDTVPIANLMYDAQGNVVNTDWQDAVFRTAMQHSHVFSVSGGTDFTNYYFSLGYSDQEGISVANSLRRYSFRANIDQKVNKWLKIGFSSGVTRQENKGPLTGSNNLSGNTFAVMRMMPNVPVYDPNDPTGYNIDEINPRTLGRGNNRIEIANGIPNQRFVLDNDKRRSDNTRLLGNVYAEIGLLKGLTFRTQIGIDGNYVDDYLFQDPRHGDGFSANGRISQAFSPSLRWNWQNLLTYSHQFGEKHNLDLTVLQEYQKERNTFYQTQVSDLSDRFFQENIVSGTYANQEIDGGIGENGIASYLGRVNYNFARRYYISASIRRDALSSLAEANRVGYFPGASFAWRISEEGFWGGSLANVVSDLRLRGSYAEVGNVRIGNYPYIGSYGSAPYGLQNGITYNNFGNDGLQWESQKKMDFGVDFGLFDGRINASVAYWRQDNDQIILSAPTAPSLGIPGNRIFTNIGNMRGDGIEFTIDALVLRSGNFRWNTSVNFTTQNNEVLSLVKNNDGTDQDITGDYNIIRAGESINAIYGFDYYGVNPANGNPVYQKADGSLVQQNIVSGAYTVFNPDEPGATGAAATLSTSTDRRVLGSALPKWFGGFDNNFYLGAFDLNVFMRFSGGNMIMNRTRVDLMEQAFNNNGTDILGRWQSPENPGDGQTPKLRLNASNTVNNPSVASTRWVEKGDFLRLANVAIGYTMPKTLTRRANIESLRIFVQAQNLLTITGYSGLDPETNTNGFGVDFNGNPQQQVFTVGANLGF